MNKPTLQAFHTCVLQDPLFAAEGMDIENASRALDEMEKLAGELEAAFSSGSFMRRLFFIRYPIAGYAIPIPFLRAFLECETARRSFETAPSSASAEALLASWEHAAREYQRCLDRYRGLHRTLLRLESMQKEFSIVDAFGNRTGAAHIRNLLQLLDDNAKALSAEVSARKKLFLGTGAPRARPSASLLHAVMQERAMSSQQTALHAAEIQQRVEPFRHSEILERYGPLAYTLPHYDGKPLPHTFLFYIMRDRRTGIRSMWVAADRFLFTKVWAGSRKADMADATRYFFSGGLGPDDMRYWYEPAGHLYITRDPRYWMDIATLVDIERRPELEREHMLRQRSSLFDLLLGACALDLGWYLKHTKRRARTGGFADYSYLYGLSMRSFPAVLYLTFNASVWRLSVEAPFLGERFEPHTGSPYISESDVIEKLSSDELARVMAAQRVREDRETSEGWV